MSQNNSLLPNGSLFLLLSIFLFTPSLAHGEVDDLLLDEPAKSFQQALLEKQLNMTEYIEHLNQLPLELVCLGETHIKKYRDFYSQHFFSQYKIDTLMLEISSENVDSLVEEALAGEEAMLLGAPIGSLIRSAKKLNPNIKFAGIEATAAQKLSSSLDTSKRLTRESFIAHNVMQNYEPGQKHLILIGSLHCSSFDRGLGNKTPAYVLLQRLLSEEKTRSIQTRFFDRSSFFTAKTSLLELGEGTVIFKDTPLIQDSKYNKVWKLKEVFVNYDDLIYVQ